MPFAPRNEHTGRVVAEDLLDLKRICVELFSESRERKGYRRSSQASRDL